ncbi:hypothetical protein [Flammeovirga agarivorans]|uniref:DUF4345 domain-containing protein n=1 Tax=Flammeovirga agarivorans TaxID=2726742 RepID=A0A7X8SQE5_9BACT|nr:hypothetical protein [Flammeovirga agarivorans]NLR94500.1 hypothetical protein [Flammeovirga agarivorans]
MKNIITKNYFLVAGILTLLGALPVMLSPELGTYLLFDFTSNIPTEYLPIIIHWGVMAVGLGGIMITAHYHPTIRWATALFAVISKTYIVFCIVWFILSDYNQVSIHTFGVAADYSMLMVLEALMVISGVFTLQTLSEKKLA